MYHLIVLSSTTNGTFASVSVFETMGVIRGRAPSFGARVHDGAVHRGMLPVQQASPSDMAVKRGGCGEARSPGDETAADCSARLHPAAAVSNSRDQGVLVHCDCNESARLQFVASVLLRNQLLFTARGI